MRYNRPSYGDPSVETEKVAVSLTEYEAVVPKLDTPVTPRENFRRAISRSSPIWMPNSVTDTQSIMTNDVMGHKVRGMQIHSGFDHTVRGDYRFLDWFGADWTWVTSAGGAMLTPGTQRLSDITQWENELVWPNLSEWGFEEKAKDFLASIYDPRKALKYDIGRGMTERLVSLLGGYTEGMLTLATEPEAVRDFFERYTAFVIETFDAINDLYPLVMVTLHDDWGTERDTFFSERMMEELVFEPTKRIIDHIHSKGVLLELHSCGNVTRFFPYMIAMGADVAQVQRRAVDMIEMQKKYGSKIGFCTRLEGIEPETCATAEEYIAAVRKTADIFASGGGSYTTVFSPDPEIMWAGTAELYYYSREIYEGERS